MPCLHRVHIAITAAMCIHWVDQLPSVPCVSEQMFQIWKNQFFFRITVAVRVRPFSEWNNIFYVFLIAYCLLFSFSLVRYMQRIFILDR